MTTKKTKKNIKTRIKDIADIITAVGVIGAALVGIGTWTMKEITKETNAKIDKVSEQINDIELDSTRTQLLTLISDYPNNEEEIMRVAKYYFQDLDGDWYMTSLFTKWAESKGLDPDTIVKVNGGK